MTRNPYAAPPSEPIAESPQIKAVSTDSLDAIARRTFYAWEKLRIVYIGVLVLITLGFVGLRRLWGLELSFTMIVGAVGANVCFFAGPVVETYVVWLGYRGKRLRYVLFSAGLALSIGLAVVMLALIV